MLFVVGTFIISLIIFLGVYFKWFRNLDSDADVTFKNFCLCVIFVCSAVSSLIFTFCVIFFSIAYFAKNVDRVADNANRDTLVRLLEENYNPDNLKAALDFNATQKRSNVYNQSLLWYCWENCYVLDTIKIPTEKFVPSNYVKLEAVIEQLTKAKR